MKVWLALGRKKRSSMRWRGKDTLPREGNHPGVAAFVSSRSLPSPDWHTVQQRRGAGSAQGATINGAGASWSPQAPRLVARGKLWTLNQGASTRLHGAKCCHGTSTWSRAGHG